MSRRDTNLMGAAGEHLTAGCLCRLGWAASITPQGYRDIDLVAVRDGDLQKTILVQCKAAEAGSSMWLNVSAEGPVRTPSNSWCVLISFKADPTARPDFFVVPMQVIHVFAWAGFANAVKRGIEKGRSPKPVGRGALKARDFVGYQERWDLLDLADPDGLPYAFEGGFWDWLRGLDLPPDIAPPTKGLLPPPGTI